MNRLLPVLLSLAIAGCGAVLNSSTKPVRMNSNPSGATVIVDGAPSGQTPMTVQLSNHKDHTVLFRLEGYGENTCLLTSSAGAGYVIADVFLTGLVGIIVDAASGGWSSLDQDACFVDLQPGWGESRSADW